MTLLQLISLLLAGVAAACAQFSVTAAYSYAPAKEISVFDYSQVVFSAILGLDCLWSDPGRAVVCRLRADHCRCGAVVPA